MDQRIIDLKSTTFSGRRVNRQQIADIQETVALLPNDSRNELAKTICEHLGWKTAKGTYKVGACLGMLETLESHGILKLPPRREDSVRDMKAVDAPAWTSASDPQPEIAAPLADLRPLRVEPVTDTEGRQLWNAFVDRHHYLGYRRPFGAHVRYFVTDRDGRRLGCVLFEAATKTLPSRDRWIGWNARTRDRRRHLVAVNSRFLVFPWVVSRNLASSALAMATRRLADDWERLHGVRPVLCETFVDETRFRASCYRAANWERIGETAGKGRSRKGVYVMPLCKDAREILRGERDAGKPEAADAVRTGPLRRRRAPVLETLRGAGRGRHGRRGARGRALAEAPPRVRQPADHAVRVPPRRRAAGTGLPGHALRALGAVRRGGRRAAAGRAPGGVDGLRGTGEAGRGRVQAPAPGGPRRRPRMPALEGPQDPGRRRVEDHPAAGARRERLPRCERRRPLPPGHGQRPLPAARPHPGRLRAVRPRERARGRAHAPGPRRRGRRHRVRPGLLVLRDGAGPPGPRAGLRLPHQEDRQPRVRRLHRLGRERADRDPRRAQGRDRAARQEPPRPPGQVRRPGTRNSAWRPPCTTAAASTSGRSPTCTMVAGPWKKCTRAGRP